MCMFILCDLLVYFEFGLSKIHFKLYIGLVCSFTLWVQSPLEGQYIVMCYNLCMCVYDIIICCV